MKGIDVSTWNGSINWNKVKEQVDFVIIRLGYIGNRENKLDNRFEEYYKECKKLNIPIGVYVYSYVKTVYKAKIAADWTIEQLKNKELDLPIYIDMEDASLINIGKKGLTSIVDAYNQEIEKHGYWAGVYANLNWFNNYLYKDEIRTKYTTWIAHYGVDENKYKDEYDILQYISTGKVNGISGNVDMNIMYRDLVSDIKNSKESGEDMIDGKIVEMLNRITDKYGINDTEKAISRLIDTYVDDGQPAPWAIKEVKEAEEMGLTDGSRPEMFTTRQEAMIMCLRTYKKIKEDK